MFQTNLLLGIDTRKVDDNRRIIIPKDTGVAEGEMLCLIRENDLAFKICSYKLVEAKLEKYRKLINCSKSSKEELERKNMRDILTLSIMDKVLVDCQNRVRIPKVVMEEYQIADKVILCGSDDHLKVFSCDEKYDKYIKRLTMND